VGTPVGALNFFDAKGLARCADPLVDPEWFFNEPEYELAKITCEQCPVKAMCAEWAIRNNEPLGVYGGLTPEERKTVIKKAVSLKKKKG
jgi:hypothetical protein